MYFDYSSDGLRPTSNEKRRQPKDSLSLEFNGNIPLKPSPIKVRKNPETRHKVNCILPGYLKSLPVFFDDTTAPNTVTVELENTQSATNQTSSKSIHDSECESDTVRKDKEHETSNDGANISNILSESTLECIMSPQTKKQMNDILTSTCTDDTDRNTDDTNHCSLEIGQSDNDRNIIETLAETYLDKEQPDNDTDRDDVACTYCKTLYCDDESKSIRRIWIGCDNCKKWMHKTCIPKSIRPGIMKRNATWYCNSCIKSKSKEH